MYTLEQLKEGWNGRVDSGDVLLCSHPESEDVIIGEVEWSNDYLMDLVWKWGQKYEVDAYIGVCTHYKMKGKYDY